VRREDLERFRDAPVDDLIGPNVRLLLVGVNPGLWTAAVNAHFARPGNRFWPALQRAGITDTVIDASRGLDPADAAQLIDRGVGITNLVNRATARADELTLEELRVGAPRLRATVAAIAPAVVAVLGLTAYRLAFARPRAIAGRQPEGIEGSELWVAPNPSGLNAHENAESLAAAYRRVAEAAGVIASTGGRSGAPRRPAPVASPPSGEVPEPG
jgi:TDG/mug DNA glycosylase family protein